MNHLLISLLLLASTPTFAQSAAGGGVIQGTVKDTTGAAVPNTKITISHQESGVVTKTGSNHEGYYTTPPLNIGKYKFRAEAAGMKAWEGDLIIETGKVSEVNPVMVVGQVNETVSVTDAAPLVTTAEPTAATTLDARRIMELPVDGRDLNTLLSDVTPGLEQFIDSNPGVRNGGLMTYSTAYVQDGAPANNREFGGSAILQGLDSIGEVRIETSTSSVRYNTPGTVIVTTKSGTNQIRGSLYETMRNNSFGVARARQDVFYDGRTFQTPKLIRNEFGGTIGGPVMLPSFGLNGKKWYDGRNRTFFFFSREGQEVKQGLTRDYTVATEAMRKGDFSGLIDGQGRLITLYDPQTTTKITTAAGRQVSSRLPFNNNQIPIARESPLAKFVLGITRVPTDTANPLVTTNLKAVVPASDISDNPATARLDHKISDKDTFFIKFNGGKRTSVQMSVNAASGPPTTNNEANVSYISTEGLAGALNWTHIFSSSFFMETLVTRNSQTASTVWGPEQKNWPAVMGLPNPKNEIGWPSLRNVGFSQYLEENRRAVRSIGTNAEQNFTKIQGKHNFQFGWRYHLERQAVLPDQGDISGDAYFNSMATALESPTSGSAANPTAVSLTGHDFANFFLGYAARYEVGLKRGLLRLSDKSYSLYLQDKYKVSNRLTLTPGIRWDINPAFTEDHDLINAFDTSSHSLLLSQPLDYYYKLGVTAPQVVDAYQKIGVKFSSAADLKLSSQIFQNNYFDIAPRLGFAYRLLDGKKQLVIRGGYGLYISAIPMRTLLAQFSGAPPFRATYSYNPNNAPQSPDGNPNYLLRNSIDVVAGLNTANIVDINTPTAIGRGVSVVGMGPLPSLRVHEWNLALERELSQHTVLRFIYNGKHGVNADQLNNINPTQTDYVWYSTTGQSLPTGEFATVARRPYDQTAYTDVRILEKTGYINTSVFSVELERRFSKGLGFQLFHAVTNALRLGGNSFRDSIGSTPSAYLPGSVPTDTAELNRFLNYQRDSAVPKHRTRWNWNYEIPVGKGRQYSRNAPRWLDAAIGGWNLSGTGTVVSTWFSLPTNQWGESGKLDVYGTKYPILDCRATPANATKVQDERCFEGYLYFNGYISERQINSRNGGGLRNGVFGLPSDYKPAMKPIIPWPKGGQPGDPGSGDWDSNVVFLRVANGTTQRVTADTGLHPWRQQYRLGPFNWTADASLLKFFSITERVRLRLNLDMFNVLNRQGLNTPASDGIVTLQNSFGGFGMRPRQLQVSARLVW